MKLAHQRVASGDPDQWLVILHGILGSRSNWRSVAKRIIAEKPEWGAILVDLRLHGDSRPAAPPHTLATAAHDLSELVSDLGDPPVRAVLGHSFGGKVALAWAREFEQLDRIIVVDANPGTRSPQSPRSPGPSGTEVHQTLDALDSLRFPMTSRADFQSALTKLGLDPGITAWLAMNLELRDDGYHFKLDLADVRALLADHSEVDLWSVVESTPAQVHFIIGGKSDVFDAAARKRAAEQGELHILPQAGHFVHVDAPEELHQLVLDCCLAHP